MQSDTTPEIILQQINKTYKLLDEIFHKLDTNNLDEDHYKYMNFHLDEVIKELNWINTYMDLGD